MSNIHADTLPDEALSLPYIGEGAYVDCYRIDLPRQVTLNEYIEAFYTTPLFKVERAILSVAARRPSNDHDARRLASGHASEFSIWSVEQRLPDQILLCEFTEQTRSWLMVAPLTEQSPSTRLYFGSVVVPRGVSEQGQPSFGPLFHALKGFHHLYSRALLKSAYTKLAKGGSGE